MGLLEKANQYLAEEKLSHAAAPKVADVTPTASALTKANAALTESALAQQQAQRVIDASIAAGAFVSVKPYITTQAVRTARRQREAEAAATEQHQQAEAAAVAEVAGTVEQHRQKVRQGHFKKLRRLITAFALGLTIAQTPLSNVGHFSRQPLKLEPTQLDAAVVQKDIDQFARQLGSSSVSNAERDILAKMLYGEAGLGTDPFEVLHTVLNRKASPLFKGSIKDIVTAPGQYIGYQDTNPVTTGYRRMVDMVIDEWEANGEKTVDGCDHFYFVTGISGVCNKFEISHDHQGQWVSPKNKQYAKLKHYCPVAEQQAATYYAQYGQGCARNQ